MLIPNNLLNVYSGSTFSVELTNGNYSFRDYLHTDGVLINDISYLNMFIQRNKISYNSVLIGGLGIGFLPYWISQNTDCNVIDVIEKNNELASWVQSNNHLDPNINIIVSDIYNYSTSKTYDLILMDLWWGKDFENIDENQPKLVDQFSDNVNQNGCIYFCLTNYIWTKS